MGDRMRPIPFAGLLEWLAGEYGGQRSLFGIPQAGFFRARGTAAATLCGERCDTPLGPAAGPHTQLAQNIAASFLVGGRFIELKTVQKLDALRIAKPCIDARDEGYNTEWSTELSLPEAFDEYLKAWLLLHLLERALGLRRGGAARSFLFNMSVGYDLEGIRTPGMQSFIDGLRDASGHPLYRRYLGELEAFLAAQGPASAFGGAQLRALAGEIPGRISDSVTLSTMHGCPPGEIEAICNYLLKEKRLHTFVKLNPTLLGFEAARALLEGHGFGYVAIREESFARDLQYADAVGLLRRLLGTAAACGLSFGVKLSNTLGARNPGGVLPGEEMYLSGRALFPLTVTLAARLAREFAGALPISFSGGASQLNAARLWQAGLRPITLATDLLKPGGYLRLREAAERVEEAAAAVGSGGSGGKARAEAAGVDAGRLERIAEEAAADPVYQKAWRGEKKVWVGGGLPLLDCYVAPCVSACPIRQEVPRYLRLAGAGRFAEALEVILRDNPLPNITGHICDHQCMHNCTRRDYEGAVAIREVKRIAAERGRRAHRALRRARVRRPAGGGAAARAAVIGAGPAGLAAAFYLARAGLEVTVFEKSRSAGGVVRWVLPGFRLPAAAVRRDIRAIASLGVRFRFGAGQSFSLQALRAHGFRHVFVAIGAEVGRKLELGGDNPKVFDALSFLRRYRAAGRFPGLGRRVAVIGGGNTAVDSARAAVRVKGVAQVVLLYRRTAKEMPADREELENAARDGVAFEYLLSPESFLAGGVLRCRRMALGEPDSSGRRRPVPTGQVLALPFDSVIGAIGEQADAGVLRAAGLETDAEGRWLPAENVYLGGDARRGPSTVVQSIADAKEAAAAILAKEGLAAEGLAADGAAGPPVKRRADEADVARIYAKKGLLLPALAAGSGGKVAGREALRCLECDAVCNKCVEVCPNRANLAIPVDAQAGLRDARQILHLDALCNECGNCGTFCPYDGLPYKDKLTLFAAREDFEASDASGFWVEAVAGGGRRVHLRLEGVRTEHEAAALEPRPELPALALVAAVLRDHGYLPGAWR